MLLSGVIYIFIVLHYYKVNLFHPGIAVSHCCLGEVKGFANIM